MSNNPKCPFCGAPMLSDDFPVPDDDGLGGYRACWSCPSLECAGPTGSKVRLITWADDRPTTPIMGDDFVTFPVTRDIEVLLHSEDDSISIDPGGNLDTINMTLEDALKVSVALREAYEYAKRQENNDRPRE